MLTQEHKAHPWLFEDAGLRLEDSAALAFKAIEYFDKAIALKESRVDDIKIQRESLRKLAHALRGKALHFLMTLAAQDARMVQYDDKQFALVIERIEKLLIKDLENQGNNPSVAQKLTDFQKDPKAWLKANLNPQDYATPCTLDWTKWTTHQE
jgi:hypothetical protein